MNPRVPTQKSESQPHQRWPAERFFWALLEAPGYTRAGELPIGLRQALEDEVPAEDLHAVCAPAADGRLIVCAAPREVLRAVNPGGLRTETAPAEQRDRGDG